MFAREGQVGGRGRGGRRAASGLGSDPGGLGLQMSGHVARRRRRRRPGVRGRRPPRWRPSSRRRLRAAVTSCLRTAARLWGNFTTLGGRRRDCELRTNRGSSRQPGKEEKKRVPRDPHCLLLVLEEVGEEETEAGRKGGPQSVFFFRSGTKPCGCALPAMGQRRVGKRE